MAVTRSTAADRRRQTIPTLNRSFPVQGMPGLPSRQREAVLLLAGALVVLLGMALVYFGATRTVGDLEKQLASGEVVNVNALRGSDQLLPVLDDIFEGSAERAFAAEQIWKRAHEGKLPNIGELSRIRVAAAEIEGNAQLESLQE
ncbi:MAG TPA: hypothetical protein VG477_06610, partial [Thermoanaerobaculia bacterium]|nr:hypothetical protein [Thermoanaerobaculia bacterium]